MANIHLVKDESIGGIQREFIEVNNQKATVGDYVHITHFEGKDVSKIRKVTEYNSGCPGDFYFTPGIRDQYGDMEDYFDADEEKYRTLIPTNVVHIDGVEYRLDRRKAAVGEQILIVNANPSFDGYSNGYVLKVKSVMNEIVYVEDYGEITCNVIGDEEYRVLVPIDSEPAEPTPDIHDLIANLAQRVTSLERIAGELVRAKSSVESQLDDAMRNIERQAQDHELVKFKVVRLVQSYDSILDEVASNTKDIAFLDERTYEKPGKPTKSVDELLREIYKLLAEDTI